MCVRMNPFSTHFSSDTTWREAYLSIQFRTSFDKISDLINARAVVMAKIPFQFGLLHTWNGLIGSYESMARLDLAPGRLSMSTMVKKQFLVYYDKYFGSQDNSPQTSILSRLSRISVFLFVKTSAGALPSLLRAFTCNRDRTIYLARLDKRPSTWSAYACVRECVGFIY